MFKPLPLNFQMSRYGLTVRLVTEEDTDFILSLRTDKDLTKFIHPTEASKDKQLEWFAKYRVREAEGRDYYFIYFKDNKPIGLNRVYNIFEYYGTSGSWLCCRDNRFEDSMATYFFEHDIMFEIMGLDMLVFDVRKANKQVWKLHKSVGALQVGESDIDFYFVLTKEAYEKNKIKKLQLLGLI